jgi:hypothetical protein
MLCVPTWDVPIGHPSCAFLLTPPFSSALGWFGMSLDGGLLELEEFFESVVALGVKIREFFILPSLALCNQLISDQ